MLTVTERVVKILIVLNVLYGAAILVLLLAGIIAPGVVFAALTRRHADDASVLSMRLLMIAGFSAVPVMHVILVRLRAMLETVRARDPFIVENARRLDTIAIAVAVLEIIHLVVGGIVRGDALVSNGIHIDWSFSLTPWIAVLLLLVLARVFAQGAQMRADLEGTV